ncbi:MAG TPA: carbonic anhydrase [Chloroflexia bacterium]|nr:carbonic anhydrase [Chloroflexia bacterium]
MGVIDEAIRANRLYAQNFSGGDLPAPPALGLAVVTCKDARLMVEPMLGLKQGDAHIIRNAGGIVTEDVIRSLVISHYMLFVQEFMVINHTQCGLMTFTDEELRARVQEATGTESATPASFHTFVDLEANVRQQVRKIKTHPWIPAGIPVRGFIYDVRTGLLSEVS